MSTSAFLPLFTPADRIRALCDVAQAARCIQARSPLVLLEALQERLTAALERLDEIERYLGDESAPMTRPYEDVVGELVGTTWSGAGEKP